MTPQTLPASATSPLPTSSPSPRFPSPTTELRSSAVAFDANVPFGHHLIARGEAFNGSNLIPFQGGIAGYLAYEWGADLERVRRPRGDGPHIPDAVLGLFDWVIAWDHVQGRAWIVAWGKERLAWVRERLNAAARCLRCDVRGFTGKAFYCAPVILSISANSSLVRRQPAAATFDLT